MAVPILKGNLEHGISIKTVESMGLQEKCQAKYLRKEEKPCFSSLPPVRFAISKISTRKVYDNYIDYNYYLFLMNM